MNIHPRFQTQIDAEGASPLISVVVPVHNEALNLQPLITAIGAALLETEHEIVYVDDGSTDATPQVLAELAAQNPKLIYVRHVSSCGQSAAVITGVKTACGRYVATLDGDGQNDPADIPAMLDAMLAAEAETTGPVLIAGHRVSRQDSDAKRFGSRIANAVRGRLLKDGTPDSGCGLKLFRRAAFLELPHFDHIHRFLPALFIRSGGKVISVPVRHHARAHGASHYGTWDRLRVGVVDLLGVAWLQRRWKKPIIETNL